MPTMLRAFLLRVGMLAIQEHPRRAGRMSTRGHVIRLSRLTAS